MDQHLTLRECAVGNEASIEDAATCENIARDIQQQSEELQEREHSLCELQAKIAGTSFRAHPCGRQLRATCVSLSAQLPSFGVSRYRACEQRRARQGSPWPSCSSNASSCGFSASASPPASLSSARRAKMCGHGLQAMCSSWLLVDYLAMPLETAAALARKRSEAPGRQGRGR